MRRGLWAMQFNLETYREDIASLVCPHCGRAVEKRVSIESEGTHFARIHCLACSAFVDWLGLPRQSPSERKRKRRRLVDPDDQCEFCLRRSDELPGDEKLQRHHLDEWGLAGSDDDENARIYCTACHALVLWVRTYFGHYHPVADVV